MWLGPSNSVWHSYPNFKFVYDISSSRTMILVRVQNPIVRKLKLVFLKSKKLLFAFSKIRQFCVKNVLNRNAEQLREDIR